MQVKVHLVVPQILTTQLQRPLSDVLGFAGKDIARNLKLDFQRTTRTWATRPEFDVRYSTTADGVRIEGGTDDKVWNILDAGAPPHVILPKKPGGVLVFPWGGKGSYTAKTTPGVIGSGPGGPSGKLVFLRRVNHPGITPRNWIPDLAGKWSEEGRRRLESYLDRWSRA